MRNILQPSRRPRPLLVLFLHLLHGAAAGLLGWTLTVWGLSLQHRGQGEGVIFLAAAGLLVAFEAAFTAWLYLRRYRMKKLFREAQEALKKSDAAAARTAINGLLGYIEYRANPGSLLYALAVAELMEGRREEALDALRRAGPHPASMELRCLLLLEGGQPAQARRLAAQLAASQPNRPKWAVLLAACEQASGEGAKSRETLAAAEQKWPRHPSVVSAREALDGGMPLSGHVLENLPNIPA